MREQQGARTATMAAATHKGAHAKTASAHAPRRYWLHYTLAFAILAIVLMIAQFSRGYDFIWSVDGVKQYYPFFIKFGSWLRESIICLFTGQPIAQWGWTQGLGQDMIQAMDGILDPFNFLAVFFPPQAAEAGYVIACFLRLWVSGAAFSLLSLLRGNDGFPTLLGAITYVFSASAMEVFIWPGLGVGFVALPLMLVGVEKLFQQNRPWWLVFSSLYMLFASVYFSYMTLVMLLVYCVVRVVQIENPLTVKAFFTWVVKVAVCIALGALLAGISLAPTLSAFLGTSRAVDSMVSVPLFYSAAQYPTTLLGLAGFAPVGTDCYVGFGGVALLAMGLLWFDRTSRTRNRALAIALLVATICLLVPAVGSVMNGFNYATNRWVYGYAALVAYGVVRAVPRLLESGSAPVKRLAWLPIAYTVVAALAAGAALVTRGADPELQACFFGSALFLVVFVALCVAGRKGSLSKSVLAACLAVTVAFSSVSFLVKGTDYLPLGQGYATLYENTSVALVPAQASEQSDTFSRYDTSNLVRTFGNYSLNLGLHGTSYYSSIYNSDVDRFIHLYGLTGSFMNNEYENLGNRLPLEALLSVRYRVEGTADDLAISGYASNPVVTNGSRQVKEALATLPLGYAYDTVMSESDFQNLNLAERQEASLYTAIVPDEVAESTSVAQSSWTAQSVQSTSITGTSDTGCQMADGKIEVSEKGATLTLSLDGTQGTNQDVYLELRGLSYKDDSAVLASVDESASALQKLARQAKKAFHAPITAYTIMASVDGQPPQPLDNYTPDYGLYGGRTNFLVSLGHLSQPAHTITLYFYKPGAYTFDSLQILCQSTSFVQQQVQQLSQNSLQNVSLGTNGLTGDIQLNTAKMLFFSIPYSQGWTATVDGQPAELLHANIGFMALELQPGEHSISLSYETPGLHAGAGITLVGIVILVAAVVVYRRKER